jgi:hypothetical protein
VGLKLAGHTRTKITGRRRKWRNEALHDLISYLLMEAKEIAYGILVGKPEGERTFKRTKHRWEEDI